jgi:gas vesicle protein
LVKNESATISIFNDPKAKTSKVSVTRATTDTVSEASEELENFIEELDETTNDELEKVSDEEFSSETSAKEL